MTGKLTAVAVLFIASGAAHLWQLAEYRGLEADCERRVSAAERAHAETRQAHERALAKIRAANDEALQAERERAARARDEAVSYAQQRDESRARAASLRGRLDDLSVSNPADCAIPADRVRLIREAVMPGSGDRDAAAGTEPPAGHPDDSVPAAAGSE